MFSIFVSELTPEMMAKSTFWRLYAKTSAGHLWANTRHRDMLYIASPEESPHPLIETEEGMNAYEGKILCFPVSIMNDGTEIRVGCPQMPDDIEIGGWGDVTGYADLDSGDTWTLHFIREFKSQSSKATAPSSKHYPRKALGGPWVWSVRR